MSKSTFNALASLALLAGAPVVAQAAMTEMAEAELSDVSGQALLGDVRGSIFSAITDPFINSSNPGTTTQGLVFQSCTGACVWTDDGDTKIEPGEITGDPVFVLKTTTTGAVVDNNYLPATIGKAVGDSVDNANKGLINFHLLPLNLFGDAVGATTDSVRGAGRSIIGSALLPLTSLTSGVGSFNGRVLDNFKQAGKDTADTATRIAFTPLYAVINPVQRTLDTAAKIGSKPVNAVLNPVNNAVDDVSALAKGVTTGARFSAVGALGGATTRVLGAAAATTNSTLLTNMAIASDQARVQQQAKIAAPIGVTVTVPKYTIKTSVFNR